MRDYQTKLSAGGRLGIPSVVRKELGMNEGEELIVTVVGKQIRVMKLDDALEESRRLASKYKGKGSMVKELIAERREEVKREQGKG